MTNSVATLVKNRVLEKGQGKILTIRDFDDIPKNDIVRKTLSQLTPEGKIKWLANGILKVHKVTAFGVPDSNKKMK